MRFKAALLGVAVLAGCDQFAPVEVMPLADARANLIHIAGAGSATSFCTEDGQREFRTAVRNFTAAADSAGQSVSSLGVGGDEAWGLVAMGMMARIVEPGDLRGDMSAMAFAMNMPGVNVPGLTDTQDAMSKACPELVRFYRAAADLAELQRVSQSYEHGSRERRERFAQRVERAYTTMGTASEALQDKMRENGWDGEGSPTSLTRN